MSEVHIPLQAIKGRGAATRLVHRFERDSRGAFDDGWGTLEEGAAEAGVPVTEVTFEDAKSAITQNSSPDIPFDYGLNPYRGCEHGCIFIGGCDLTFLTVFESIALGPCQAAGGPPDRAHVLMRGPTQPWRVQRDINGDTAR